MEGDSSPPTEPAGAYRSKAWPHVATAKEAHSMTTNLQRHAETAAADVPPSGWRTTRMVTALRVAALVEGLAAAVIVGLTGSLPWQLARVLLVGALTALAVWGLGSHGAGFARW